LADTIIVLGAPSIAKTGPSPLCVGDTGTYSIPVAVNTNYVWHIYTNRIAYSDTSNNQLKIAFDTTGNFKVTVVAFNSCFTDSATWVIKVIAKPVPKIVANPATSVCKGTPVTLTASGGTKYLWNNGANTAAVTIASVVDDTTCSVKVSNAACSVTDTVKITLAPTPTVKVVPANSLICAGDTVKLTASGALTYIWSPGLGLNVDTGSVVIAKVNSTITYQVKGTNAGGCSDSVKAIVTVDIPATTISSAVSLTTGQSVTLNATGGGTYQWIPPTSLSCTTCPDPVATPTTTTIYTVTITDSNHCTAIDTVTVEVEPLCGKIFVPDVFSPNGDGHNDVLYVRNNCIKAVDFIIYDRWGNKLFETTDPNIGWDGTYNGKPMNTGTYAYYVNVLTYDNKTMTAKGNVALVR